MPSSVIASSSQMSGSSSTMRTTGLLTCASAFHRPALRIREHDAEDAAAAGARLVTQRRAVALAELARNEEPETGAAACRRHEGLEDALAERLVDARPAVGDLEK